MRRVGLLFVILLVSSEVLLASAGRGRNRDRGERVRIRKKPKGRDCERVKEPMCVGIGLSYNRTRLPNVFGHSKQKLVTRALQNYRSLVESGCSPYIRVFLCSSFLPECPRKKRNPPLQPCQSLCEKARRDCESTLNSFGLPWPDELGCENLPETRLGDKRDRCINFEPPRPDEQTTATDKQMDTTTLAGTTTTLTASLAPVIDGVPQDIMIAEGQGATLKCHAEGALEYSWSRIDGIMPEQKIVSEMVLEDEAILVLHNLTREDSGFYTCSAENDAGIAEATAKITVMAIPQITRMSRNLTINRGEPFVLTCQATGSPQPRLTWERKDGKQVLMSRNGTSAIVTVESTTTSNAGIYFCKATNSLGFATDAVHVKVLVPPRWDQKPLTKKVNEGDDVTLRCKARGTAPLNITWHIENGKNVSMPFDGYPRFSVDSETHSFRIEGVQPEDKDFVYHCDVANEAGSISASAMLQVIEHWQLPKIITPLPNVTAFKGDDVRLACETSGDPAPQVTWFLQDLSIDTLMDERFEVSESGEELLVRNLNLRDSGTYTCVAGNTNGLTTSRGQVRVVEPSLRLTRGLTNTTVHNGSMLHLVCAAAGEPKPEVTWFFNDQPINVTVTPSYVIDGGDLTVSEMTPKHEGKYGCLLNNEFFVVSSIAMVNISRRPITPSTDNEVAVPYNRTSSPNEVALHPSVGPDTVNKSCEPCPVPEANPSCEGGQKPDIKPRRYDITDAGLKAYFRGWVDVTGQGAANDYCRIIMTPARGLDTSLQLACALAGTAGHSEYNYVSGVRFDVGQMDTWFMKDDDGDGRDDYCRCVGDGPDGQFVYCTKADIGGFQGAPGIGESQYSFKASGDRRLLRKCRKRKVDPFFGVSSLSDN